MGLIPIVRDGSSRISMAIARSMDFPLDMIYIHGVFSIAIDVGLLGE